MRVLICHNYYQQSGGEDQVFTAEVDLLRRRGHAVETFIAHNDEVSQLNKLNCGCDAVESQGGGGIAVPRPRHRAQIVHFHNTFPLLSPASIGPLARRARWCRPLHNIACSAQPPLSSEMENRASNAWAIHRLPA